jgi:hypothetical protein
VGEPGSDKQARQRNHAERMLGFEAQWNGKPG